MGAICTIHRLSKLILDGSCMIDIEKWLAWSSGMTVAELYEYLGVEHE